MCFSATASFSLGAALLSLSVITSRRARTRSALPYALIPALFGIQQLLEGVLWLSLDASGRCGYPALVQIYSVFSQVIWPVYIPLAVLLLEPPGKRRALIAALTVAGTLVSGFLLFYLAHEQVLAQAQSGHVAYIFPHFHEVAATGLYVLGACVGPLCSSHRAVRIFGLAVTVALLITYVFYTVWFISVWCFLAATMSVLVLAQFPGKGNGKFLSTPTHG